jgi:hypothetical protein
VAHSLNSWHPRLDNPTLLGWSVVVVYLLAASACARAAWIAYRTPGRKASCPIWSLLAALLFFLGVNKQLNLQTLLIVLGRQAALAGGWYARRRAAQAAFSVLFALAAGAAAFLLARRAAAFFRENPFALRGLIVLLLFVLIRSATINHAEDWFAVKLYDDKWGWILELCGSVLLALSALHFTRLARA